MWTTNGVRANNNRISRRNNEGCGQQMEYERITIEYRGETMKNVDNKWSTSE